MTQHDLDPIDPESALQMYLTDREPDVSQNTIYAHRSRLGHFRRWFDQQDLEAIDELTGRHLHQYRLWRREDGDLNRVTEKTQMDTLRVFIRWCEDLGFAARDLHLAVQSPTLEPTDNVRDVMLDADLAQSVLDYLDTYEYATLAHVSLLFLWRCGLRIGALHALDVDDYDADEQALSVEHRPETDTPLKNKADGNRYVALAPETCLVVDDWLESRRPSVTDKNGREPLCASTHGRAHKNHLRKLVYKWTRPCAVTDECPHGRTIDDCEATGENGASKCPSSVSPHAIRRGAITHWLKSDWPTHAVGDRANVSREVLEVHYDQRTERERMEQRRAYLDTI